ncbi:L,D-transpeptidase family protein [Sphingomonas panacisoli]|uniref:L,D-transpeptidase family protein n=1 Tax=Sphingomonas panacisoli TaxID=1813879 RepID=A0A5B8LGR7_9SPHN|nr:L,D-transpeptidase family protein [Sphingomonas panacisoli]QDZ07283.1 L,D-transpeptidase family protein [Sphingomonas panacisoli]
MPAFARFASPIVLVAVALVFWTQSDSPRPLPAASKPVPDRARVRYPAGKRPVLTLPNGDRRTVESLLNVRTKMKFGDFVWNDDGVKPGPVWIRIDLARQTLSVFRSDQEIGSAVILYGTDGKPTPTGVFPILDMAEQHSSNLYDAEMPYMLRLTNDGVAIHASNVRFGSATHGCIGVPLEFARLLYAQVKRGDLVAIVSAGT